MGKWGQPPFPSKRGQGSSSLSRSSARRERRLRAKLTSGSFNPFLCAKWPLTIYADAYFFEFRARHRLVDQVFPVTRKFDRNGRCGKRRCWYRTPMQTSPTPIFRPGNQLCAQRVAFNVSQDRKQVMVRLNEEGLVPSLPKPSRAVVLAVMSTNIGRKQPAHPVREICIVERPHDQVNVVWHQARCEDGKRDSLLRFVHGSDEI